MKWQSTLTKTQLKHMRGNQNTLTLRAFFINLDHQSKSGFPCFDCNSIALRLLNAGIKSR